MWQELNMHSKNAQSGLKNSVRGKMDEAFLKNGGGGLVSRNAKKACQCINL
jgi:hypothetical protein